jgi:hypothetical protein
LESRDEWLLFSFCPKAMVLAAGTERFVHSDDAAVCAEAAGPGQGLEAVGGRAYRMVEVVIGKQGLHDRIPMEQATSMRYHDAPLFEDRLGIGFYYTNFSTKLPEIILPGDEIGLEIFYNIAATHWLYVTPAIQVIEPAGKRATTAFLTGLRLQMRF